MCMQCLAAAATTVGAASGLRAWLAARAGRWMTPPRKRVLTLALTTLAILGAGLGLGGTG
jgi:hypothetical protein